MRQVIEDQTSNKKSQVQTIVLQEDGIHETNIGVSESENKVTNEEL